MSESLHLNFQTIISHPLASKVESAWSRFLKKPKNKTMKKRFVQACSKFDDEFGPDGFHILLREKIAYTYQDTQHPDFICGELNQRFFEILFLHVTDKSESEVRILVAGINLIAIMNLSSSYKSRLQLFKSKLIHKMFTIGLETENNIVLGNIWRVVCVLSASGSQMKNRMRSIPQSEQLLQSWRRMLMKILNAYLKGKLQNQRRTE